MRFEVGKSYITGSDRVYEILFYDSKTDCYIGGTRGQNVPVIINNEGEILGSVYQSFLIKEYTPKQKGKRWVNIYEWKTGTDSNNHGSAPSTVHWWKEDAETSARFKLAEGNLIRLACIEVDWEEGQGL